MKSVLFFLCVLGVVQAEPEPATVKVSLIRQNISEVIMREFSYQPSDIASTPHETDPDVVMMPQMVVTKSRSKVEKVLREKKEAQAAEEFTWKNGGNLLEVGRATVMFKYSEESKGFHLLRIKF